MFAVEVYAAIRHFVFIEGNSRREAARVFGLSRETVLKMCRFSLPPGYTRTKPVTKPKLGALLQIIERDPASVYRLLKAHDLITSPAFIVVKAAEAFTEQTTAPNQLWQTDFTYLKVTGWGWFYLSTILDDFSRFIVAWKLCTTMRAGDVTDTLELALAASGCDIAKVVHRPRLLSDNGASYVAGDLARWLEGKGIAHIRGAPNHPQTQGKIERWHQTLKNRVLLENYFLPGQLEAAVGAFVDHYNHRRYHESLGNLTPADVYFGRGHAILEAREKIKKLTIRNRRLSHHGRAA